MYEKDILPIFYDRIIFLSVTDTNTTENNQYISDPVLLPIRRTIRSLCTYVQYYVQYYNVYTCSYTNKCRCGLVVIYHARQLFTQEDVEQTTLLYYVSVIQTGTLYITVCTVRGM
jgi:hypothetical protein